MNSPDVQLAAWQAQAPEHWQRPFLVLTSCSSRWPLGSFDSLDAAIACAWQYLAGPPPDVTGYRKLEGGGATRIGCSIHHAATGRRWGVHANGHRISGPGYDGLTSTPTDPSLAR